MCYKLIIKPIVILIAFSLSLSGYCAAAYAFGHISVQGKVKNTPMTDMPDCPFMKTPNGDGAKNHSPAKTTSMNCKACCMSLVGFPTFVNMHYIGLENLELSYIYTLSKSEIQFPILHPPNI